MAKKRSPRKRISPHSSTSPNAQRLNKILAAAGLGSRRKVEELIEQGRVEINGDVVTDLSCKVEPEAVKIKVDGQLLKKSRPVYFALNKPPGVLSTNYDPSGRMRVIDLVPDRDRVFSVGRLDQSSEGLMLLTNDGDLAQRLAHPRFHIQKSYFVVVAGQMTEDELNKLRKGVHLAEGLARIDGATIKRVRKGCTELEIVLSEGKNREIRRILARAGHKVVLLRRIAIGPLRLGQMPVGASRTLTSAEVKALYVASDPARRIKSKAVKDSKVSGKPATTGKPWDKSKKVAVSGPVPNKVDDDDDDDDDDDLLSLAIQDFVDSDEEYDTDFVGDLSGAGGRGRVIAFDDEVPPAKEGRASRASKPRREPPIRTAAAARREARATGKTVDKSATKKVGRVERSSEHTSSSRVGKGTKSARSTAYGANAARESGTSRNTATNKSAQREKGAGASSSARPSSRSGGSRKPAPRGKSGASNARGKR